MGELYVLDELSRIAPVIAVQGNDEAEEVKRALPFQAVLSIAGTRIVVAHGHEHDFQKEMALRKEDAWGPKLDRWFAQGKNANATINIFGHIHIPMQLRRDDILIINPGALASGGALSRQTLKTVALLFIFAEQPPEVAFIDLRQPDRAFQPVWDWDAGFSAAHKQTDESILEPTLAAYWTELEAQIRGVLFNHSFTDVSRMLKAVQWVTMPYWMEEHSFITGAELMDAIEQVPDLPPTLITDLRALLITHR